MKIISVEKVSSYIIEIKTELETLQCTRHSSTSWFIRMGDSDEPVYDHEGIEKLFQRYMKIRDL